MTLHKTQVRVRYQETDQMGVVYYANYFVYFEIGRTDLLRNIGMPYSELEKEEFFLAVFEAYCKYKAPARYDDLLIVRTWISKVKYARIEIGYEIWRDNEKQLVVEGNTTLACLDKEGKPRLIPDKLMKLLKLELETD
ncbi:MAG: acyl-CoA thioesterase [Candidatus Anammoxibacter sp.]